MLFLIDRSFISPKRVQKFLTYFYLFILVFIWIPAPFKAISEHLSIGRPVDLLIYSSLIILCREFILSRQRFHIQQKQLTALIRETAITKAKTFSTEKKL